MTAATRWACALGLALAGVTATIAFVDADAGAVARHVYLVPVLTAAIRFGFAGGGIAASAAVLLHAPFVLPQIERTGLTTAVVEGLATFVILLLLGALTGALTTRASRERARYRALLTAQRVLGDDAPLDSTLARLGAALAPALDVNEIAIVVRDGGRTIAAGSPALGRHAATAATLETGGARFVPDAGDRPRPRRILAVPVTARGETIGALAVARVGELPRDVRAGIATLGAHIGLGLENARLALRQRRFADELADKVASATRRLEEMDRAKSMFVATASHELRTPLTALLGFSELLTMRRFPPEEVRRLAALMQRETERLVRLVDDLLDLSRLERGLAPPLRLSAIDVAPALAAAVAPFRHERRTHEIHVECAPALSPVRADPDALDRIVKNLIANAIKYSPPGPVCVTARAAGAAVEIEVADRGRGIPAEALPKLFEPYFRVPETADRARGAGLGLAVVKALVDAHGGVIAVDSDASFGTRVRFTMPVVS